MSLAHRRFGWIPQRSDSRDKRFSLAAPAVLPKVVDPLGLNTTFIKDQGNLGACTGHASTTALEIVLSKGHYSRLMAYYEGRALEGNVDQDVGAEIRDVIKGFTQIGLAEEESWPYDVEKFNVEPDADALANAQQIIPLIDSYEAVESLLQIKTALAAGLPVVFGFSVPESFMADAVATSGWFPMAAPGEKIIGGHAVCAVGYDDSLATSHPPFVWVTNSWGLDWGVGGRFMMEQRFFTDSDWVSDCWVIHPKVQT